MEDRQPSGLLLEMIGGDADAAARWQSEVATPGALATGSFGIATPFRNLRPDESRFQRKVEEFGRLTVYEIEAPNVAAAVKRAAPRLPEPPPGLGVRRIAYRRHPRASQGRLTGNPTIGLFLILISPSEPARAQELRDWADFTHISYIAAAAPPGFATITPYEHAEGEDPLYLHFYELDTPDPLAAVDDMPNQVCKHWDLEFGGEEFLKWAMIDALDIHYVNVFGRDGAQQGTSSPHR